MGNQGTTNWKFSAFFAITLMLVAGLFSTTAMAADGDGVLTIDNIDGAAIEDVRLEAGGDPIDLVFIYTLDFSVR